MKRLLSILALFSLASIAHASPIGDSKDPFGTVSVAVTTYTVNTVSISSWTPVWVDSITALANYKRRRIEVENVDTLYSLWCGPLSTTSPTNGGRKILPGQAWTMDMRATTNIYGNAAMTIYCVNDGTSTSKAVTTQLY